MKEMNYKEVSDILAEGAFGLTQVLWPYYEKMPPDVDYTIWDTFAFELAYFYTDNGIDQHEIIELISQFSKKYPDTERQNMSKLWVQIATQFYGSQVWKIKIGKCLMPDVIIHNLCRPSTQKIEDIPIAEQNPIIMVELWTKIISYLTTYTIPRFNKYFTEN